MGWREEALRLLNLKLGAKTFTAEEAARLLSKEKGFSKGTTYRLLHDLAKKNKLAKLGRGLYRFPETFTISVTERISESVSVIGLPESDETARRALKDRGLKFMITGLSLLSVFVHHFPRRMIHLVYVVKGGGENARGALKESGLRCLLKPSRNEIKLALEEFPEKDVFVIRESSDFEGEVGGVADLERALVDTYFEATRGRIPFPPEEVGRMVSKAIATRKVNISHLLELAGRRGIKGEFRTILENLVPDLKLPGLHVRNDKVDAVLAGIGGE